MAFSEFENKKIEKLVSQYIEGQRPPEDLRDQVDLSYRIKGQSVVIFEVRDVWNQSGQKCEIDIAKTTYVKTRKVWKVYWQKRDLKWHSYDPDPEVEKIEEFLKIVQEDAFCCFWG